eukprot:CAMPEP_0170821614 /NCGR_PEP_ID=MMETSP0733-20121128/43181_1 /TAXON_ID=186038 /ORGANISM="Fragilariopsis kerguelensis, Strain L26-C5" /LENGTH=51 /DNA_ID=CAMNT_0011183441 /DNA_START=107 /DNA_END=262 /DNA_ORIENTATION=-
MITLWNAADAVDESKEDNDFVFDNNTDNDDTNTGVVGSYPFKPGDTPPLPL